MAETPEDQITIKLKSGPGILLVAAAVVTALLLSWFGVRWQIANMLGELTSATQENALPVAEAAIGLSSRDPLPRELLAKKLKDEFSPESIEASVIAFEETVRRTPNDFRAWIDLARAYEQADKMEQAERSFKRAIALAPAYTFPQWQIGNFYLRRDRVDEAFNFLTQSTEKSIVYREQVFALAWDYFEKDPAQVEKLAANRDDVRVSLARFFAQRGAAEDALRVWNSVPEEERARHPQILRDITLHLYSKRFYRQALEFARESGMDTEAQFETITNPGFEKFLGDPEENLFGWRINRGDSKLDIGTDPVTRTEGQRSLKLNFKGYSKPELHNVVQLVAVQPGARYRLTFMMRVENLRTGGEPLLEVVNANSDLSIVRSQRFPQGSHDWQEVTLDFAVPEDCDGITIRTTRETCGDNCPINGVVWYDDLKLTRS